MGLRNRKETQLFIAIQSIFGIKEVNYWIGRDREENEKARLYQIFQILKRIKNLRGGRRRTRS